MVLKSQIPNEQKAQTHLKHDYDHEQLVDARNKRVRTRELVRAHANTAPLEKLPAELLRDILVYSQNTGLAFCSKPLCGKLQCSVSLAYRYILEKTSIARLSHQNVPSLSTNITAMSGCANYISKSYCTVDLLKLIDERHPSWPRCVADKAVGIPKRLITKATLPNWTALEYLIENGWINGWENNRTNRVLLCCAHPWQPDPDSMTIHEAFEDLVQQGGSVRLKMLKCLVASYEKRNRGRSLLPWNLTRVSTDSVDAMIVRDDIEMLEFLIGRFYAILPHQKSSYYFSLALRSGSFHIAEFLIGSYRVIPKYTETRRVNKLRKMAEKKYKK